MPVPQENTLFVEQASCLLLTMVEHLRGTQPALYFKMLSLTELARSTNLFATFAAS